MITLKHLARDYNLDPYAFRMALRGSELHPLVNGRWKWSSKDDPEYKKAEEVAQTLASRSKSGSTDTSTVRASFRATPSPSGAGPSRTGGTSRRTPSSS